MSDPRVPLWPTQFFDPPLALDTSVTNIPGSGSLPLQVIATTGVFRSVGIQFIDATNQYIGVYTGAIGAEKLACIIGGGLVGLSWGQFPPASRISLRSITATAISSGIVTGSLVTLT